MIKKLRNRFALTNLLLVSTILLVALTILFTSSFSRIKAENSIRMQTVEEMLSTPSQIALSEDYNDILVYVKTGDQSPQIYVTSQFKPDSNKVASAIEKQALTKSDVYGYILGFRCRYYKISNGDTTSVVVMDIFAQNNSLGSLVATAVLVTLLSIGCYCAVCFVTADIAIRPLGKSWNQQKQFVADASHELKTPLSVILANLKIISSHPDQTVESQLKWIENTNSEAEQMTTLVQNLLFLAKDDNGLKVPFETFDLSDCVTNTALGYDAIFYENNKKFEFNVQEKLFTFGNEGQLKQLVTILLDNANKYSENEGNIVLSLATEEITLKKKCAVLSVSNDCAEISDDQLEHIFDRFYSLDVSRSNKASGNGLGLSIARVICKTHNAKIDAELDGNRITFTATFPLTQPSNKKQSRKMKKILFGK